MASGHCSQCQKMMEEIVNPTNPPKDLNQLRTEREHDTYSDGECWCIPTLSYVDEETGCKVWVHKSDEEMKQ